MITRQFLGRSGLTIGVTMLTLAGGLGVATATNGGSLNLGHRNKATSTTTLADRQGIPLSLVGKKSEPRHQVALPARRHSAARPRRQAGM
jgi:hypothetical protein